MDKGIPSGDAFFASTVNKKPATKWLRVKNYSVAFSDDELASAAWLEAELDELCAAELALEAF